MSEKFIKKSYLEEPKILVENGEGLHRDENASIVFGEFEDGFTYPEHTHWNKTIVIVVKGSVVLKLDGETVEVNAGEYVIFGANIVEEVISTKAGTQSFTLHLPSVEKGK